MANKKEITGEVLDAIDINILRTLQEDARLTTKEVAHKVHLSTTPVFERIKRLEREGYIRRYIAVLNNEKLNLGFMVFCSVKLRNLKRESTSAFTAKMLEIPEVTECYNISGHFDYMLKIYAANMKAYQQFLLNVLGNIEALDSVESTFVMEEIKQSYGINI
ncbi:MAG: Lrp/AsnC family transcriptional regulator [Muribaculaceae bacterium]